MGRYVSRALALFIAGLFVIITSLSACTLAFRTSLLDTDTYTETFLDQNAYEDIIPYIIPVLLEDNKENLVDGETFAVDLNDIAQFMSIEDWRNVANQLIPPTWLQTTTEALFDSIDLIALGDFSQRENVIDLSEIIQRLQGEEGRQASEIIIDSAPACSAQQMIQLRQFDGEVDSVFPICNPPQVMRDKAVNVIADSFHKFGVAITVQLRQTDNQVSIPEQVAQLLFLLFKLDSQLAFLLFLCPMALIGLIIFFAVRSIKGFGRWLGWTFIASGIITVILIFTSQAPVFSSFDDVFAASTEIERFEAQIYAGLARSVYADASATMLVLAGAMIGLGFILLAISAMMGQSRHFIVPEGSVLVSEDGRVISTSTHPQNPRTTSQDDKP